MLKSIRFHFVYTLITIAILAALASIYLKFEGDRQRLEYNRTVILTFEITILVNEIVANLVDLETGQRGYFITGDRSYFEPFLGSFDELAVMFEEFKNLAFTTNVIPSDTIQKLEDLISFRKHSILESITIFENQGFAAAQTFVSTGEGKRTMDEIRNIQRFINILENDLLISRSQELYDFNTRFTFFNYAGLLFSIIIMFASALLIRRKAQKNDTLLNDISSVNIKLSNSLENQLLKDKYIGMAAHDLRNPIGAIFSYSELIMAEKENLSADQFDSMNQIVNLAEHSLKMLGDMLDVQKIDENKFGNQLEDIEPGRLFSNLCAVYKAKAEDKNITLHTNIEAPNEIRVNKSVLIQVFDNLVSNAIKYSPHGSGVWVDLKYHNEKLQLRVKDEGPGIPANELPLLFKRFEKLSNRPTGGETSTGLGLSIVNDRLDSINGSIECISEPGKGTEFIASIPVIVIEKD
ncbi:MAG: hypothetical protein EA364_01080 [Balneolaceae bacterium]|nr:MAG: hypothetical protein EA364_01080 [Balneolaceae bacterium]